MSISQIQPQNYFERTYEPDPELERILYGLSEADFTEIKDPDLDEKELIKKLTERYKNGEMSANLKKDPLNDLFVKYSTMIELVQTIQCKEPVGNDKWKTVTKELSSMSAWFFTHYVLGDKKSQRPILYALLNNLTHEWMQRVGPLFFQKWLSLCEEKASDYFFNVIQSLYEDKSLSFQKNDKNKNNNNLLKQAFDFVSEHILVPTQEKFSSFYSFLPSIFILTEETLFKPEIRTYIFLNILINFKTQKKISINKKEPAACFLKLATQIAQSSGFSACEIIVGSLKVNIVKNFAFYLERIFSSDTESSFSFERIQKTIFDIKAILWENKVNNSTGFFPKEIKMPIEQLKKELAFHVETFLYNGICEEILCHFRINEHSFKEILQEFCSSITKDFSKRITGNFEPLVKALENARLEDLSRKV